jgi:DNA-binding NarL/FixJ family response regulator
MAQGQPSGPISRQALASRRANWRVLQGIVDLGGTPKVAKALGVAEATVRSHLKNLFAKTGTRRQADLVKLVAGAASPFAG